MNENPEQSSEPTMADVMVAISGLRNEMTGMRSEITGMQSKMTDMQSTMTDGFTAVRSTMTDGFAAAAERDAALDAKMARLEDRLVKRTELLRADIAGVKAEIAIDQAFSQDTATALRQHIADPHAHELQQRAA